jgi:hypothetical protein
VPELVARLEIMSSNRLPKQGDGSIEMMIICIEKPSDA